MAETKFEMADHLLASLQQTLRLMRDHQSEMRREAGSGI
jgi:hypothetical protein